MSSGKDGDSRGGAGGDPDESLPQRVDGDDDSTPQPQLPLPPEFQELLDGFPAEERTKLSRIFSMTVEMASSHSGPLPTAPDYAAYEQAVPGTGQAIVDMAHQEQGIKKAVLTGRVENARLQIENDRLLSWGIVLGIVGLVGVAGLAVWLEQPYVAMFMTGLSAVVATIIKILQTRNKKGNE